MTNPPDRLKILITGCYPPPYGGGSVYIQRLFDYLSQKGHRCHVFDVCTSKKEDLPEGIHHFDTPQKMYLRIMMSKPYDILHINEGTWKHKAVLVFIARIKGIQTVLTLHSFRDTPETTSGIRKIMLAYTLKNVNCIVSSGSKEMKNVQQWFPNRQNIRVETPFIVPDMTSAEKILPEAIADFLRNHPITICANGSNLGFFKGEDVYGLDLMVELCHQLQATEDIGVIFCLTRVTDPGYLLQIQDKIAAYGLTDHFLIYTAPVEFWKIIERCHVFIRPTRTDSFGISVAEGIFLGTPTIASDVCDRPEGTILFRSGDMGDLLEKTLRVLNPTEQDKAVKTTGYLDDGAERIESVYYDLVAGGMTQRTSR